MLPFPNPQSILDKSLMITDEQHELNPPLPAKDSYLPFSLPLSVFPLEGLHDLLIIPAGTGSTGVLQDPQANFPPSADTTKGKAAMVRKNVNSKIRSRKRSAGRTDRNSKIHTAAGLRDRRMRLSLDVARNFFDLQDMLGFDRASKTVLWLLTNSRAAIKELMAASASKPRSFSINGSPSGELYSSELCEDASPSMTDIAKGKSATFEIIDAEMLKKSKNKSSAAKEPQKKAASNALVAKNSRAQARARARERTREKKIRMCSLSSSIRFGVAEKQDLQNLKSLSNFQDRDLSSKSHGSTKLTSCEKLCEFQIASTGISGMATTSHFSYRNTSSLNDEVCLLQEQLEVDKTFISEVQFNRRLSHTFNNNFTM